MSPIKVVTVLGTRPEIIRLSRVIAALEKYTDHRMVHTGQNYDHELYQIFFDELALRKPDYVLGVDTSSLGAVLGGVISSIEPVLLAEKPDAVLILGDTNSALAAIMAKRLKIPVYHMEAGNRCFDLNVPEEINRRLVDHISDFNLVYTEHARRHLLSEGLPHRRIYLTGSPMAEVLGHYRSPIDASAILSELNLEAQRYFAISVHREENVDSTDNLQRIVHILNQIAENYGFPVILSAHPRTRKRLEALADSSLHRLVNMLKPFGFFDYVHLQQQAYCTLSDSGTISEESAILGFPAITLRTAMERPEVLDRGSMIMTGFDLEVVLNAIELARADFDAGREIDIPDEYKVENVSQRVVKLITGTCRLSNAWDGIETLPIK